MILFINGPFGIGKSTVASELKTIIESSAICDLEYLGQIANSATESVRPSPECTDDFQDIPLWRVLSAATLNHLAEHYPGSTFIVPMTIGRIDYFHEVIAGVGGRPDFWHFCLMAPIDTVRARLKARGDPAGKHSWGIRKAELYIPIFESDVFETHVSTVGKAPNEIARHICEVSGITTLRN